MILEYMVGSYIVPRLFFIHQVKQYASHPALLFWSFGNEVFLFAHPPISPICRNPLFPYLTF